jgi:death-on-curing protein
VILYLSVPQVLDLHAALAMAFGGPAGVRERGGLASAVARPAQTFDGEELYPDVATKAAALMHSLVLNHPFVDGNKRVGAAAAELFIEINGGIVHATDDDFERITLETAQGRVSAEALAIWFRQRLVTGL